MQTCIEDWKTTPWRKIDVENMDIECKKFAKDVRLLDKEMRNWDTVRIYCILVKKARSNDECLVYSTGRHCEKHVDQLKGGWRTSKPGYQRASLAPIDDLHESN